ncbi:MAG TPA: GAF domain-containing protein, partial [Ramlibacter sp.]|uniref:GAF domain-containing protein n=1 Tax=Ramlibacter sp. TaxID=1917967 RepID=UPI002ED22692
GSLAISSRAPREPAARDRELASLLTGTASIVIARHAESVARRQAEEALRERDQRLARDLADAKELQAIAGMAVGAKDAGAVHRRIVEAAAGLMQSEGASLQLLDEAGMLRLLAWKGFHAESAAQWQCVSLHHDTTCGAALQRRDRVIVSDVEASPGLQGTEALRLYRLSGLRTVQSTPLVGRDGAVIGMLSTHWKAPHEPTERDLALLDLLARQAADALESRHNAAVIGESEAS